MKKAVILGNTKSPMERPEVIGSVIGRLQDALDICVPYMHEDMYVLDLGTKDCLFFDVLKGYNKISSNIRNSLNLTGIDCCPEAIDICKNKHYKIYNGDVQDLSMLVGQNFDFIFIVHTLEHVPSPNKVVEECLKIINPGGFIFVEVPIQSQIDKSEKWGHYHPFTSKQQVKDLFSDNFFDIVVEDSQKTKSKKPWYRILFQMV